MFWKSFIVNVNSRPCQALYWQLEAWCYLEKLGGEDLKLFGNCTRITEDVVVRCVLSAKKAFVNGALPWSSLWGLCSALTDALAWFLFGGAVEKEKGEKRTAGGNSEGRVWGGVSFLVGGGFLVPTWGVWLWIEGILVIILGITRNYHRGITCVIVINIVKCFHC